MKDMALPPHQPERFTTSCTTEVRSGLLMGTSEVVSGTGQGTLLVVVVRPEISPAVVVKVGELSLLSACTIHSAPAAAPVWVAVGVSTSLALVTVAPWGIFTDGKRRPTNWSWEPEPLLA